MKLEPDVPLKPDLTLDPDLTLAPDVLLFTEEEAERLWFPVGVAGNGSRFWHPGGTS